ncbi:hypothetical protein IY145_05030 [Methylosinus sp. H3A]|uniref:hypothetical protein n=1 Tax=Methylosinus sp. H3A TaxID=2785786 RepID=UPI0018C2E08D|nr:hypothetical protein [Methylosinus sp. H3A]MBG0808736.1 hypothetical protein [Methylosinus sp. H3A]
MPIDWEKVKSRNIRNAFSAALGDDKRLSHLEVVNVLRAALADGYLSDEEVSDMAEVARNSASISPQSQHLLLVLKYLASALSSYGPIIFSTLRQKYAAEMICSFLERSGRPYFPNLDRNVVGVDLLMRVANPNIINQSSAGICGPVAFLYSLAFDSPATYAKFAIDLYEKGKAKIGGLEIEPGPDCRKYAPTPPMSQGDWLTGGSLRDSERLIFDYDSVEARGSTTFGEMADWFQRAGYADVDFEDNLVLSRGAGDIGVVNKYFRDGYRVVLRINSRLLVDPTDKSYRGNHIVVLRSPIDLSGKTVRLSVYTWGQVGRTIPEDGGRMPLGDFLEHWYGYLVAKPF